MHSHTDGSVLSVCQLDPFQPLMLIIIILLPHYTVIITLHYIVNNYTVTVIINNYTVTPFTMVLFKKLLHVHISGCGCESPLVTPCTIFHCACSNHGLNTDYYK